MIKQRSWGDCGIAALSNALAMQVTPTGPSARIFQDIYDYVLETIGRDSGVTIQEICSVLHARGYLPVYIPFEGFQDVSGINGPEFRKVQELSELFHPAIVQVKTSSGSLHFVYFDGHVVHDP